MKPFKRTQRINKQVMRLLSEAIQMEIRDPRVRDVVITQVDVSPDFSVASVYFQTTVHQEQEALLGLDAAKGFLRTRISLKLRSKRVPNLRFFVDRSAEKLERLEEIFERIHADD